MNQQVPTNNPLAITSLVCGIISLPMVICCYGLPFNGIAVITGFIAISQIDKAPDTMTGKGMAIAGIVLGVVSIVLLVLQIIFFGVMMTMA